ncbi:hypothetical protein BG31_06540 [Bacillus subtilis subsp. subtilis]|nr:hypothetical protein BG31_06540 [Bacillus subtilis subsp. subtilis]
MENNKKAFYLGLANLACKKEHLKAYISFPFKNSYSSSDAPILRVYFSLKKSLKKLMYFLEDELSGC